MRNSRYTLAVISASCLLVAFLALSADSVAHSRTNNKGSGEGRSPAFTPHPPPPPRPSTPTSGQPPSPPRLQAHQRQSPVHARLFLRYEPLPHRPRTQRRRGYHIGHA